MIRLYAASCRLLVNLNQLVLLLSYGGEGGREGCVMWRRPVRYLAVLAVGVAAWVLPQ